MPDEILAEGSADDSAAAASAEVASDDADAAAAEPRNREALDVVLREALDVVRLVGLIYQEYRERRGASLPCRFIRGSLWLAFDEMALYHVASNELYDEQPLNRSFRVYETGTGAVRTTRQDRDVALIDLAQHVAPFADLLGGGEA